jgi:inhibitor of KinA
MTPPAAFPRFRAVADSAVLVEFGEVIEKTIHAAVLRLDRLLAERPVAGVQEAVPAYASLLVTFDPLVADHEGVTEALRSLLDGPEFPAAPGTPREVLVCYDAGLAPDLAEVSAQTGLDAEAVIAAHLSGDYRVFMYGFAPGFAYLAGVPPELQVPRKASPVRDVAAGSVIIAGPQCLVMTLKMPTGWWVIGRSPTRILQADPLRPFLFDVGDPVRFRRIDRSAFDALARS